MDTLGEQQPLADETLYCGECGGSLVVEDDGVDGSNQGFLLVCEECDKVALLGMPTIWRFPGIVMATGYGVTTPSSHPKPWERSGSVEAPVRLRIAGD